MSFLQEVQFRDGDDLKTTQKKLRVMMEELSRINRVLSRVSSDTAAVTAADVTYGDETVQTALDEIFAGGTDSGNADTLDGHPGSYYLAWANFTGVPSTFPPAAHTHAAADISYDPTISGIVATQVQAAIDALAASIPAAYTDEQAQDAVGGILLNTATIVWTYADAVPTISANVPDAAITFAKFVNATATARLVARKTASGGPFEECTLSEILDFIGSAAQGDILYRDAAGWARLAAGTSGRFLKTLGAGANPLWDVPTPGAGSLSYVSAVTIAGAAATNLTISSLDLDADEEYIVRLEILNATAATPNISMFYNADTTAGNYDSQGTSFDGAGTTSARANTAVIGGLSASTSATFEIWLRRNLSAKVMAHAQVIRGTTTTMFAQSFSTQWRTASTNVTGITINSSTASALAIGSKITVWKRRAV